MSSTHFCPNCEMMFYTRLNEEHKTPEHYCRNCGETKPIDQNNIVISSITLIKEKNNFDVSNYVNEYTKYDKTLPRKQGICINCNDTQDLIIKRYDDSKLKYLYICSKCNHVWDTSDDNLVLR